MSPRATAASAPRVDPSRTYSPAMTVHGRAVERGTELTVAGIRGRVAFVAHVRHVDGAEWVDVITARGFARTVHPNKIKCVHRRRTGIIAA